MATLFGTFRFVKSAITFLALFNYFISTKRSVVLLEAVVFPLLDNSIEDRADVLDGARTELVVVVPVAAGGAGEHDVVTTAAPGTALRWIVVRGAKVVTNLVS